MRDRVVTITPDEQLRMHQIVLDKDADEALALVKLLLDRIESASRREMKTVLDK